MIELHNMNHSISMPFVSIDEKTNKPLNRDVPSSNGACHSDVSVIKHSDYYSPILNAACCSAKIFKTIVIHSWTTKVDGSLGDMFFQHTLTDCYIAGVSVGLGSGIGDESISINYGSIAWKYATLKEAEDGAYQVVKEQVRSAGWDRNRKQSF